MEPLTTPVGHPFSQRQIRLLKWSIAIMSALIVLGLLALVFGMARQASRVARSATVSQAAAPYNVNLVLGEGEVRSIFAAGGALVVDWKGTEGTVIISIDAVTGKEVGRIAVGKR